MTPTFGCGRFLAGFGLHLFTVVGGAAEIPHDSIQQRFFGTTSLQHQNLTEGFQHGVI